MSDTADIADSAIAVQGALTAAEAALKGDLPEWFTALREQIHGLVTAGAWAVGEDSGASIIGFRCEGRTHAVECSAYRAAEDAEIILRDGPALVRCPRCTADVHSLFSDFGICHYCWKEARA